MKKIIISLAIMMLTVLSLNGATISGQVQGDSIGVCLVEAFFWEGGNDVPAASCYTSDDGTYQLNGLNYGTYVVRAGADNVLIITEYYDNVYDFAQATPIVLNANNPNAVNIDFFLESNPLLNIVSGVITNEDGEFIENAHVDLVQFDPWLDYYGNSNENGEFEFINVESGIYTLKVRAYGYNDYTYPTNLFITEGSDYQGLDIVLSSEGIFSVSGVVRDAETGLPVNHAYVSTLAEGGSPVYTDTNENGEYTLLLLAGQYQIYATLGDLYDIQYYDHADSPLDAEIIEVNSDITGIDFDLAYYDYTFNHSISGTITENGEPPLYQVMAVAVSSDQDWVETTEVSASGYYQLANLPSNEYYVLAVSSEAPPTYYADVLDFEDATPVVIDNSSATGIDIHLNSVQSYGVLTMNGFVTDLDDNPVANTTVIFINSNNEVDEFAFTNDYGYYEAPNLTMDNYQVMVTKIFYETEIENIAVVGDGNADFQIQTLNTESPKNTIQPAFAKISNYPNPFLNATTISYSIAPNVQNVELIIYNLKGQKVKSFFLTNTADGESSFVWDGKDESGKEVNSGIYFTRMKTAQGSYLKKMIKMK